MDRFQDNVEENPGECAVCNSPPKVANLCEDLRSRDVVLNIFDRLAGPIIRQPLELQFEAA